MTGHVASSAQVEVAMNRLAMNRLAGLAASGRTPLDKTVVLGR
jgi:hypothetical protein